jgi:hypothetical protein
MLLLRVVSYLSGNLAILNVVERQWVTAYDADSAA